MQPLIKTIVEKATKKGGYYSIDYVEGDEYQKITNDISLLCNQKSTDEYVGISNLDESVIRIYDADKEYRGFIYWIAYNNGIDRLSDYSTNLEKFIKIDKVSEKWEDDFYLL
tara:strand:- start:708 stop:1043 length:336 start_codon:yes stop_codon:yes gene_type:complete